MKQKIQNYFEGNYYAFYNKYLSNAKQIGGDEYQALCPFHEDTNPSLTFNTRSGLFKCFGCEAKGDIYAFYGKQNGLNPANDFPKILEGIASDFGISDNGNGKTQTRKKARVCQENLVKEYVYPDEHGAELFRVRRYEEPGLDKDFRQGHFDGNGQWIWDLEGVRRVIYNLPVVLKASEVLVVEGEKDCDNLSDMGLVATTCPMGAGKWRPEYNEYLRGKNVVLCPDNDDVGRAHMQQVAQSLQGIAKSVKWLELPGLPPKGDVSDFISTFDDPVACQEKLSVLIADAEIYEPPKKVSHEDFILTSSQFLELSIPEKRIFLNPWLCENSISLISGWRGCGKTWFALSILEAVSTGGSFGLWQSDEAVPCLFCDGEMPAQDVRERIKYLGITSDNLTIYCDALMNHNRLSRAHLGNPEWRAMMKDILVNKKIKLWVLDNLASLASGLDENSKQEWDPINQWLLELRFSGIATMMLHHMNKTGGQRGTSGREDNLDVSISLEKPSDYVPEDGARFVVNFTKARISNKDLAFISPTEFKLVEDVPGAYSWNFNNVKKETTRAVLQMIADGADNKTICETLSLSKGYVSKVKKRLLEDGHISTKGEVSQRGFQVLHGL